MFNIVLPGALRHTLSSLAVPVSLPRVRFAQRDEVCGAQSVLSRQCTLRSYDVRPIFNIHNRQPFGQKGIVILSLVVFR